MQINDASPSSANMRKPIPPASAVPSRIPSYQPGIVILVFTPKEWPIEMEHVEKRIVIKDVDRCGMWTAGLVYSHAEKYNKREAYHSHRDSSFIACWSIAVDWM
jgi:hypothetical protein